MKQKHETPPGADTNPSLLHLCRELDELERRTGERVKGPNAAESARMRTLERQIAGRPADCIESALWRGQRLARACLNDWNGLALCDLASAVEHDGKTLESKFAPIP
jgi:hypothetical protein